MGGNHLGQGVAPGIGSGQVRWAPGHLSLAPSQLAQYRMAPDPLVRGAALLGSARRYRQGVSMTPLDDAHAAMEADPDPRLRLQFYDRLAASELYLLLSSEPAGDALDPRLFQTEDGTFVLAFDRAERLVEFAEGAAPYAALSGRVLAQMLAGQGIGLALNPSVAPSQIVLPPEALAWLADTLADGPKEVEARLTEFTAPVGLPETLITALDARLASATGLAQMAYLVGVTYDSGARSHMLAFIGAIEGAHAALAQNTNDALVFSGLEAGEIDVAFFDATDGMAARLARVGLRFDLPRFEPAQPTVPGSDPDKPPRLR